MSHPKLRRARAGLFLVATVAFPPVCACGGTDTPPPRAANDVPMGAKLPSEPAHAENAFRSESAEATARIKRALDDQQSAIEAIDSVHAKTRSASTREKQERARARIEECRSALESDARAIHDVTSSDWPTVKAKVDEDIRAFRDAIDDAAQPRDREKVEVPLRDRDDGHGGMRPDWRVPQR